MNKGNLFFLINKKLYINLFLSTAILSDILASDTFSVVTSNITLRKYNVLLWHEFCNLEYVRSYNRAEIVGYLARVASYEKQGLRGVLQCLRINSATRQSKYRDCFAALAMTHYVTSNLGYLMEHNLSQKGSKTNG
jgi:hypothetical protein